MRRAQERLIHAGGRTTAQPKKTRTNVGASCRRIAWDLAGSACKSSVLGLLVVNESQIGNPLIKTGFVVRNTRREDAAKYLRANLGQFETQI